MLKLRFTRREMADMLRYAATQCRELADNLKEASTGRKEVTRSVIQSNLAMIEREAKSYDFYADHVSGGWGGVEVTIEELRALRLPATPAEDVAECARQIDAAEAMGDKLLGGMSGLGQNTTGSSKLFS